MHQSIIKVTNFKVDESIIYLLSDYENRKNNEMTKYSTLWSLPAKIVEVKDKVVVVKTWKETLRQVPFIQIYKLRGSVNPLLEDLNYKEISRLLPIKQPALIAQAHPEPLQTFLERQK